MADDVRAELIEAMRWASSAGARTSMEERLAMILPLLTSADVPQVERQVRETVAGEIERFRDNADASDPSLTRDEWQLLADAADYIRPTT